MADEEKELPIPPENGGPYDVLLHQLIASIKTFDWIDEQARLLSADELKNSSVEDLQALRSKIEDEKTRIQEGLKRLNNVLDEKYTLVNTLVDVVQSAIDDKENNQSPSEERPSLSDHAEVSISDFPVPPTTTTHQVELGKLTSAIQDYGQAKSVDNKKSAHIVEMYLAISSPLQEDEKQEILTELEKLGKLGKLGLFYMYIEDYLGKNPATANSIQLLFSIVKKARTTRQYSATQRNNALRPLSGNFGKYSLFPSTVKPATNDQTTVERARVTSIDSLLETITAYKENAIDSTADAIVDSYMKVHPTTAAEAEMISTHIKEVLNDESMLELLLRRLNQADNKSKFLEKVIQLALVEVKKDNQTPAEASNKEASSISSGSTDQETGFFKILDSVKKPANDMPHTGVQEEIIVPNLSQDDGLQEGRIVLDEVARGMALRERMLAKAGAIESQSPPPKVQENTLIGPVEATPPPPLSNNSLLSQIENLKNRMAQIKAANAEARRKTPSRLPVAKTKTTKSMRPPINAKTSTQANTASPPQSHAAAAVQVNTPVEAAPPPLNAQTNKQADTASSSQSNAAAAVQVNTPVEADPSPAFMEVIKSAITTYSTQNTTDIADQIIETCVSVQPSSDTMRQIAAHTRNTLSDASLANLMVMVKVRQREVSSKGKDKVKQNDPDANNGLYDALQLDFNKRITKEEIYESNLPKLIPEQKPLNHYFTSETSQEPLELEAESELLKLIQSSPNKIPGRLLSDEALGHAISRLENTDHTPNSAIAFEVRSGIIALKKERTQRFPESLPLRGALLQVVIDQWPNEAGRQEALEMLTAFNRQKSPLQSLTKVAQDKTESKEAQQNRLIDFSMEKALIEEVNKTKSDTAEQAGAFGILTHFYQASIPRDVKEKMNDILDSNSEDVAIRINEVQEYCKARAQSLVSQSNLPPVRWVKQQSASRNYISTIFSPKQQRSENVYEDHENSGQQFIGKVEVKRDKYGHLTGIVAQEVSGDVHKLRSTHARLSMNAQEPEEGETYLFQLPERFHLMSEEGLKRYCDLITADKYRKLNPLNPTVSGTVVVVLPGEKDTDKTIMIRLPGGAKNRKRQLLVLTQQEHGIQNVDVGHSIKNLKVQSAKQLIQKRGRGKPPKR